MNAIHPIVLHGLIYGGAIATVLLTLTAWGIWFERKFAGRMQSRLGPTLVGWVGLLQPLADAAKLLQKEDLIPDQADRTLYLASPPLTVFFTLATVAVIPFSVDVAVANLPIGVLWILALGGLMVFPVWTAGWASANKYALLGGMRAVAQGISYEIPMVLSALVPVIFVGSMDVNEIVTWQAEHHWLVLGPGLFAFVIFFVSSLAEANRIPFDIPEAESELVAGVTTEYSGMRFGLFYMAEYLHTLVASAVASALFLGGWNGLFGLADGIHWMLAKTLALFFMITWVRWSLVRFRSDQLMRLCWTYLVPISLALVMVSALWVYYEPMLGGH